MPNSIVFVTKNFPSLEAPHSGVFVAELAAAVARQGVSVTVISPVTPVVAGRKKTPGDCTWDVADGVTLKVLRPYFLSFGASVIGSLRLGRLTYASFERAVTRCLRLRGLKPDLVYGHFLFLAGAAAVTAGHVLGVPAVVAVGESLDTGSSGEFWSIRPMGIDFTRRRLAGAAGYIALSEPIRYALKEQLGITEERVLLAPNGADLRIFQPQDRAVARKRLGLPPDRTLVGFVGAFSERKGVARVVEAIRDLEGVAGVFVGTGMPRPMDAGVVHWGAVPHGHVAEYLAACDLFVLPSTQEGCSNSIIEALACGLPVVSSAREFNEGLVDGSVGILVEPLDVSAIRAAIVRLRDDSVLRKQMGERAVQRAAAFDLDHRADRILLWADQLLRRHRAQVD